jgi:multicomponent Na+:H+ antiporter subunit B
MIRKLGLAISLLLILYVLLMGASELPTFGERNNPVHNIVSQRYIRYGSEETGAANIVSAIILDYRLSTPLVKPLYCLSPLGRQPRQCWLIPTNKAGDNMDSIIVSVVCRMIIPFIQLYGLYIILHGHLSPGGSFSGGAILGASIILYVLVFGLQGGKKLLTDRTSQLVETLGILWFWLLGWVGILGGSYYLANRSAGFRIGNVGDLFSSGMILLITIGLGLKVASTLASLFFKIAESEEEVHDD